MVIHPTIVNVIIKTTYNIFSFSRLSHKLEGREAMDARSKIIFVSLVVPVRSGNSVISRASDNSLKIFKLDLYNIILRHCILSPAHTDVAAARRLLRD